MLGAMDQHYLESSYREKLIEHLFVGELLKHSWWIRNCRLEIGRPEVDNSGYDLIAEEYGVVRHIQLKATRLGGRAAQQNVHVALGAKPSGCVVWIMFDEQTLALRPFLFFGGEAGRPLPDLSTFKVARHTKADSTGYKAERQRIRSVPKRLFRIYETIESLYDALFGAERGDDSSGSY